MKKDTIVQFVCFESSADIDEFILQWEQYSRLVSSNQETILQQEIGQRNMFRYVSQHICFANDFQFIFKKGRRSAHSPELEMKVKEAGGYTAIHVEHSHETEKNEKKVFVFITDPQADIEIYRTLSPYRYLNIYQAYYESCSYSYILEFFAENEQAIQLLEQLNTYNRSSETGIYKECPAQIKKKSIKTAVGKKVLL